MGFRCIVQAGICVPVLLLSFLLAPAACQAAPPDATPPAVTVTEPGAGATLSGTATFRGTAYATNASRIITLVEVKVDSGGWRTAAGTSAWTFRLDTTPLEDGWHNLLARSFDGKEYSEPAGIEFQSSNAGDSSGTSFITVCVVLVVVLAVVLVAGFFYYISKTGQPGRGLTGGVQAPAPAYPPPQWYTDQTGRSTRYPVAGSPYYKPRPPAGGVPHPGPAPPRIYSPGGGQAATEAILVSPEDGGTIPPPPVVEHEAAPAASYGRPDIEETAIAGAEAGRTMVPEVIEVGEESAPDTVEVVDMGAGAWPEAPGQTAGTPPSPAGYDRRARVMKALMTMPRGLPLPLLGIRMEELAGLILSAPRKNAPGGAPAVQLKGHWYRADENNLKDFMVEYKP